MKKLEKDMIKKWLAKNTIKKCPDAYLPTHTNTPNIALHEFQKSCVPRDISFKEKEKKPCKAKN